MNVIRESLLCLGMLLLLLPMGLQGQSHNYWTRSFNEESSLLSGAVVGGGAGPSAIYYNPSSISEITMSKFSLHASLFSMDIFSSKNALGDGIDLSSSSFIIEPRFLSYMIKPKKHDEWSFEIALLNNENSKIDLTKNVDFNDDILLHLPGDERYFALFSYRNQYRDDWGGVGGSYNVNPDLSIGASMFVSVRSLEYDLSVDIEAFPLSDSLYYGGEPLSFYSASYQFEEYLKFNDYRLLWKFGMMYTKNNISVGWTLTTPSIGIYSDSKKVSRKMKESNIKNPETGSPMPDFVIADYQEKKDVVVNFKSPLSFAAGLTYEIPEKLTTFYTTLEYFNRIDPYKMVQANENPSLANGTFFSDLKTNEWLTFISGANPVLNVAFGNRSQLNEKLMLMTGFRTDFNYRKGVDYQSFMTEKQLKSLDIDIYHFSGGLTLNIRGQDLIAGLQYSFGRQRNQEQIINLSDPVEYNFNERAALQGDRQNNTDSMFNSVSLYFGATFNFGGEKK